MGSSAGRKGRQQRSFTQSLPFSLYGSSVACLESSSLFLAPHLPMFPPSYAGLLICMHSSTLCHLARSPDHWAVSEDRRGVCLGQGCQGNMAKPSILLGRQWLLQRTALSSLPPFRGMQDNLRQLHMVILEQHPTIPQLQIFMILACMLWLPSPWRAIASQRRPYHVRWAKGLCQYWAPYLGLPN